MRNLNVRKEPNMSKTVTVRNYMLSTDVGIMNAVQNNKGNWAPVGGGISDSGIQRIIKGKSQGEFEVTSPGVIMVYYPTVAWSSATQIGGGIAVNPGDALKDIDVHWFAAGAEMGLGSHTVAYWRAAMY
jgi:hypothetical protein